MGAKTQKIIWEKSENSIFETFAVELEESTRTGRIPGSGDQDVQYGMELQRERLKKKGLKMEYTFVPRGHFPKGSDNLRWSWRDNRYVNTTEVRTCELTRTLCRNDKNLYKKAQNKSFYQVITDVLQGAVVDDELYACPSCGAVSKIKDMQKGCEYCGTRFEMDDLFPKVTNYYFVQDDGGTVEEMKKKMLLYMAPSMLFVFTCGMISSLNSSSSLVLAIIGNLVVAVIMGAFLGYILLAYRLLFGLLSHAKDSVGMLFNSMGSKTRFVSKMKQYSPEFSYEYFAGKVMSLLRMLIFSEDVQELPNYTGQANGELFSDIVDTTYAGAVALKQFQINGEYADIIVEAYVENLYDVGGHIKRKIDKFRLFLRKNISKPIDYNFSIKKIQCKNCAGSFDATKEKTCPNCGTEYEIEDDDWIVTKVEKR